MGNSYNEQAHLSQHGLIVRLPEIQHALKAAREAVHEANTEEWELVGLDSM